MSLAQTMPDGAVLVAINIAKHRNEILIKAPGRTRRRRLTVLNTRAEHDRFVETLGGYDAPVVAGFEATGNYHRPLVHRLLSAGVELRLISSLALARTREAIGPWPLVGPRKSGDDPKDAQTILHMLRIGRVQRCCDPMAHGLADIQELSKTHEAISKAETELWHRLLTHYLPLHFPEAERFRGNARRRSGSGAVPRLPREVSHAGPDHGARRRRSSRPHGTSSGARSQSIACSQPFTRPPGRRSLCRSTTAPTPSPCFV